MSSYPSSFAAHQDHLFLTDGERHFGDHEDDEEEEGGDFIVMRIIISFVNIYICSHIQICFNVGIIDLGFNQVRLFHCNQDLLSTDLLSPSF